MNFWGHHAQVSCADQFGSKSWPNTRTCRGQIYTSDDTTPPGGKFASHRWGLTSKKVAFGHFEVNTFKSLEKPLP